MGFKTAERWACVARRVCTCYARESESERLGVEYRMGKEAPWFAKDLGSFPFFSHFFSDLTPIELICIPIYTSSRRCRCCCCCSIRRQPTLTATTTILVYSWNSNLIPSTSDQYLLVKRGKVTRGRRTVHRNENRLLGSCRTSCL